MAEEQNANWAACQVELRAIREDVGEIKHLMEVQNGRVRENSREIAENCKQIAILNEWRNSRANPVMAEIKTEVKDVQTGMMDQTIEITTMKGLLAKYGTLGGSLGAGIGIAYAIIELVKGLIT